MLTLPLAQAIRSVPGGNWGVAVSGGADSVALLSLLRLCADLRLHVIHLDHQARGQQSTDDAAFVADLCARWDISCSISSREQIEPTLAGHPKNLSALFRAMRLTLFEQATRDRQLMGVIVAHHADDQAETILQRLLRGSGYEGLCGMSRTTRMGELRLLRPMLKVSRADLRIFLDSIGQPWREDPSNASDKHLRNRLRRFLSTYPTLKHDLLALGKACRRLRRWTKANAPHLEESFAVDSLADLPLLLARQSARQWLIDRGVLPADLTRRALDRLVEMAADAASPARVGYPGALLVRRRRGMLFAER